MSDATDDLSLAPSPSPQVAALRARIGTLCHALRLAGPAYAGWVLFTLVTHWSDAGGVGRGWGAFLKTDLGEIPASQRAAGFAVHFVIWIFVALACLHLWRLFSAFLAGRVFTTQAAGHLRCMAIFGLAAEGADMVSRPLISMIVTAHMPTGSRMVSVFFQPPDLLNVMFLVGFLALGHVFTAAAEIAEDHAAIV